jgi:hypothetical protein
VCSSDLYRHGRLNPVQFDYMSQTDIIKMIEAFYSLALTDEQIGKLPTYEHELTPASLRHYLEQHANTLPRLIDFLRTIPAVMKAPQAATVATGTLLTASPALVSLPQQPSAKNSSVVDYIRL